MSPWDLAIIIAPSKELMHRITELPSYGSVLACPDG
jgi:hypothetical protein